MTPLFKKLNYKSQPEILILNAPESFEPELTQMSAIIAVNRELRQTQKCTFIMAFVTVLQQVNELAPLLAQKLEDDGVLWLCYPKGSSKKYKCDFNRDTGWAALGVHDFEPVRMVAIDANWSALRFRQVRHIKTMTRSFAQTEEGKAKTAKG